MKLDEGLGARTEDGKPEEDSFLETLGTELAEPLGGRDSDAVELGEIGTERDCSAALCRGRLYAELGTDGSDGHGRLKIVEERAGALEVVDGLSEPDGEEPSDDRVGQGVLDFKVECTITLGVVGPPEVTKELCQCEPDKIDPDDGDGLGLGHRSLDSETDVQLEEVVETVEDKVLTIFVLDSPGGKVVSFVLILGVRTSSKEMVERT